MPESAPGAVFDETLLDLDESCHCGMVGIKTSKNYHGYP